MVTLTVGIGSHPKSAYTNAADKVYVGVWASTPRTGPIIDFPYDRRCFVLEDSPTVSNANDHAWTFGPGDAFFIPLGFTGYWKMAGQFKNFS